MAVKITKIILVFIWITNKLNYKTVKILKGRFMKYNTSKLIYSFIIILAFYSCQNDDSIIKVSPEYAAEINEWHNKRIEKLKCLAVGLIWLGYSGWKKE